MEREAPTNEDFDAMLKINHGESHPINTPSNLHRAMVQVMIEVKGIDKALKVGKGNFAYKGVADKDVKNAIGRAMSGNGLTCVPVMIKPTVRIDRWEQDGKQKQSVFTEVLATYRITHAETGEYIDIMGYGHGQDAMDKSAGKATTYALKNALLYSYLVPTGSIDDTDATNSNDIDVPMNGEVKAVASTGKKSVNDATFKSCIEAVNTKTKTKAELVAYFEDFKLTETQQTKINLL